MGRNSGFLHEKFRALPLDAIDENNSLQLAATATAAATPAGGSPQRQQQHHNPQQPSGIAPPLNRNDSGHAGSSKVPENWTKGELIGQGAFGSVYLGMDNDTGQLIAVKQVSLGQRGGPQAAAKLAEHVRSLEAEVQLLQDLNHQNIVRYLGTERTQDALNIFLEYVPGGSIASLLAKFGSFQESVVRVYTKQILQGLLYLHGQGVIHRDIKGANILVANTGLVKLADFGASKKIEGLATMESGFKSVKGTPYWMAPEVITATGHGKQADIWSVACTVIEMATGKPPWMMQFGSQVAAMFHIAKSKGPPTLPEHLSPECKDFLYLCFNRNWKERPTAATLLQHAFLKDVDVVATGSIGNTNEFVVPSGESNQIPAYRASGGSGGSGSGVAAGATRQQGSSPPPKPATGGRGGNNTGMSPLGNHLSTSRGHGIGISGTSAGGPRRQLNLDGAAVVAGAGGGSPSKRPSAVMSSAPVFANIRDSTGVGPPSAALLDGRLTRPATTPRGGTGRTSGSSGVRVSSQQQKQEQRTDSNRSTLPDPATLGSLRRSGSASLSLSKDDAREAAAVRASGQHPATTVDMNSDLMATIALSSGINSEKSNGSSGGSHHCSLASTAQQSSMSSAAASGASTELVAAATVDEGSVDQRNTRPHSGTGSGVSQNSKKSEFNPMEEPAWMAGGGGGGAGGNNRDSLGMSSGSDVAPMIRSGSPSDEEATSIHPLPTTTTNTMMPPLPPSASRQQQQQLRGSSGSGRFLRTSSSSSQGGSGMSNSAGGTAVTNMTSTTTTSTAVQQPSGTAASASEGPVVYTIEADVDGFGGSGGLPWDMPDTDTTIHTATTISGGSSQLPAGSASLSRWGRPTGSGGNSIGTTTTPHPGQHPQVSSAAASAATPATSTSSGGAAVDQSVILTALQQCAQRDLRASLALFAEAKRQRSSRSNSLNSKSSDSGGFGGGAAVTKVVVVEDPSEVTSPARQRVSVHQSRIPRAPSESPIAKQQQQQQRQSGVNVTSTAPVAAAATPGRRYHHPVQATPTKISMMTPSRSGSLATAVTPSGKTTASRRASHVVVPQSPRATPSKQLRAAAYSSPTKRQYSASVGGGSYEQQLRARQAGTSSNTAVGVVSVSSGANNGGGGGYAARAAAAAGTPVKSANTHPLRTPRRDGGGSRPGSATATPQRRASALP
jgi:serine/threonine protein kinase